MCAGKTTKDILKMFARVMTVLVLLLQNYFLPLHPILWYFPPLFPTLRLLQVNTFFVLFFFFQTSPVAEVKPGPESLYCVGNREELFREIRKVQQRTKCTNTTCLDFISLFNKYVHTLTQTLTHAHKHKHTQFKCTCV